MNNVQLIGRLTAKPELRYTESKVAVVTFTLAVPRTYNREQTDFINCVAWRKSAELLGQYCDKGSRTAINGRIETRSYDAQDGSKRYVTEIIVDNVEFLETKKEQNKENDIVVEQEKADPFKDFANEITISDDELPFWGSLWT